MKFNFDWNYVAAGAPYITISGLALGFNAPSIALLGNPEEVIIGFDDQTMTIGVKKYDGNENVKSYKFYSRMKNGWVRIGCKNLVRQFAILPNMTSKKKFCIFVYWMHFKVKKTRRWMKISKLIQCKQKAH